MRPTLAQALAPSFRHRIRRSPDAPLSPLACQDDYDIATYDPYAAGSLRSALAGTAAYAEAAAAGGGGGGGGGDQGQYSHEVLEARQEVAVMEAAAAVLEEKLAAAALEAAAAMEARQRAEEKTAALAQETAWLQARVKALQSEGNEELADAKALNSRLKKDLLARTAERDVAQAAMKGQLQELRVGASAVGAKIALTEEVDRLKASIAPLNAALEAERAWSKEMEAQLEAEKTAKLALAAKSGAMVKALRQQLDETKAAALHSRGTPMAGQPGQPGMAGSVMGSDAGFSMAAFEMDAKAAMLEKQALEREMQFLKERVKATSNELEKEKSAARERELRLKGKYDAMLERALADRDRGAEGALAGQVQELQHALEAAFEREAELKASLRK